LNSGTKRGQAKGFKLETLTKLTDTKSRERNFTLLHFIVKLLEQSNPETLLISSEEELSSWKSAARIDRNELQSQLQSFLKAVSVLSREVNALHQEYGRGRGGSMNLSGGKLDGGNPAQGEKKTDTELDSDKAPQSDAPNGIAGLDPQKKVSFKEDPELPSKSPEAVFGKSVVAAQTAVSNAEDQASKLQEKLEKANTAFLNLASLLGEEARTAKVGDVFSVILSFLEDVQRCAKDLEDMKLKAEKEARKQKLREEKEAEVAEAEKLSDPDSNSETNPKSAVIPDVQKLAFPTKKGPGAAASPQVGPESDIQEKKQEEVVPKRRDEDSLDVDGNGTATDENCELKKSDGPLNPHEPLLEQGGEAFVDSMRKEAPSEHSVGSSRESKVDPTLVDDTTIDKTEVDKANRGDGIDSSIALDARVDQITREYVPSDSNEEGYSGEPLHTGAIVQGESNRGFDLEADEKTSDVFQTKPSLVDVAEDGITQALTPVVSPGDGIRSGHENLQGEHKIDQELAGDDVLQTGTAPVSTQPDEAVSVTAATVDGAGQGMDDTERENSPSPLSQDRLMENDDDSDGVWADFAEPPPFPDSEGDSEQGENRVAKEQPLSSDTIDE